MANEKPTEVVGEIVQAPLKTVAVATHQQLKAIAPKQPTDRGFQNNFDMQELLKTAGTLKLTKEEQDKLFAPIDEKAIEIRPDGLIYAPWVEYVRRLQDLFGTEYGFVPQGEARHNGDEIIATFHFIIRGAWVGSATGGQVYKPNNLTMNWSDAIEGAKSNARMRCCKDLGMFTELWSPPFIKAWKEKYAETYIGKDYYGKEKTLWCKKGQKPISPLGKTLLEIATPPHKIQVERAIKDFAENKMKPPAEKKKPPLSGKFYKLDVFGRAKKALGVEKYYEILSGYQYAHANVIPIGERDKILAEMGKAKPKTESEVENGK